MNQRTWIILGILAIFLVGKFVKGRLAHQRAAEVMKKGGAVVLDVRSVGEWQRGHHADAKHIPLDELKTRVQEIGPTTTPVVVYCRSGGRAMVAARILRQAGYQTVINAGSLGNVPRLSENPPP